MDFLSRELPTRLNDSFRHLALIDHNSVLLVIFFVHRYLNAVFQFPDFVFVFLISVKKYPHDQLHEETT